MKKLITVLIILFVSVRIFASAPDKTDVSGSPHQALVKIFIPVLHSDSSVVLANFIESYKSNDVQLLPITSRADSIKVLVSLYCMVSPKLSQAIEQQEHIKSLLPANRTDTL